MTDEAKKKRAEYMRLYRAANRDRMNAAQRERYRNDPEKHREWQRKYWERKAAEVGGVS